MPLTKNQIIPLKIEAVSSDGNGLGRHEGQVVFLPHTAVGDQTEVQIVKLAQTHAFGRLHTLLSPGPGRIESDCPASNQCGGCCFRHLRYEAELVAKHGFVQDALERLAGLHIPVAEVLPSPLSQRYRNKVQYPVNQSHDGQLLHGFYAHRSHRVVPCEDCQLHPQKANQIAAYTADYFTKTGATAYDEKTGKGLLRHICLRSSQATGELLLTLVVNGRNLPGLAPFCDELMMRYPEVIGVVTNKNTRDSNVIFGPLFKVAAGKGVLRDEICGVPQLLGPGTFSQVNALAAQKMFEVARNFAQMQPTETLLDLYCGTGVIGLSMAADCKALVGVESVLAAVESARQSAAEMGLTNTHFMCADAADAVNTLAEEGLRPDVVLLDPPRKGCGEPTLRALLALAPQRVVMISCNPATLARDLRFLASNGYEAEKAQPVDMFPRTRHVETVVRLVRKD